MEVKPITVVEKISRFELIPVTETTSPKLQGFYVKAIKDNSKKKTAFLVNSIRSINFEQLSSKRVRTRITFIPDSKSFEVEEHSTLAVRRGASITLFQINFKENKEPVILRGHPVLEGRTFKGKTIEIEWNFPESPIIIKTTEDKTFTSKLKPKQKIIDVSIK